MKKHIDDVVFVLFAVTQFLAAVLALSHPSVTTAMLMIAVTVTFVLFRSSRRGPPAA